MNHPQTFRVTLTYGDTLTEGIGGWSGSPWMIHGLSELLWGYSDRGGRGMEY